MFAPPKAEAGKAAARLHTGCYRLEECLLSYVTIGPSVRGNDIRGRHRITMGSKKCAMGRFVMSILMRKEQGMGFLEILLQRSRKQDDHDQTRLIYSVP